MKQLTINKAAKLSGDITVPGDKSISHRAIMLGSIAEGETIIHNFLNSDDCIATAECFREMGIDIQMTNDKCQMSNGGVIINGKGLKGLKKPTKTLDVGNSGTTMRLLSGILTGQDFDTTITGDSSIRKRPMKRIVDPLSKMGAVIKGGVRDGEGKLGSVRDVFPPLKILGTKLHGIKYELPMASAQVKSAILLAGLYTNEETIVVEKTPSRDHTERMLAYFGLPLKRFGNEISIKGGVSFSGREIDVPGDISSAAFFLVASLLVSPCLPAGRGSELKIRNVGLNPTRTGILEVLHRMGAEVEVLDEEILSGEARGSLRITHRASRITHLKGIEIKGEIIPRIIDEIPIIAVFATQAEGDTVIKDAKELRVKESDRIKTISEALRLMGAEIDELPDGMVIHGKTKLYGATIDSRGDHRIAMSCAIAGLIAEGETVIQDTECIETSFPGFEGLLENLY